MYFPRNSSSNQREVPSENSPGLSFPHANIPNASRNSSEIFPGSSTKIPPATSPRTCLEIALVVHLDVPQEFL